MKRAFVESSEKGAFWVTSSRFFHFGFLPGGSFVGAATPTAKPLAWPRLRAHPDLAITA